MSKEIRTLEHLQNALYGERVWRMREISILRKRLIPNSGGIANEEDLALLRPCVAMIYAHWEGFVKCVCSYYLQYVSFQRVRHSEMASPFLAIAVRKHVSDKGASGPVADRIIARFLLEHGSAQSYLPYKNIVETKSNLWFHVFQEIFDSLGLSWHPYELKSKMIDTKLVGKRNAIAHGQYIDVDAQDVTQLFDTILDLMEKINDQILDAAQSKSFKIPAALALAE